MHVAVFLYLYRRKHEYFLQILKRQIIMYKIQHFIRLASLLALLIITAPAVTQAQDVTYVNANGAEETLADGSYTRLTNQTELNGGWWVVDGEVNYENRITINGTVHLVLLDGATLNAGKGI